MRNCTTTDYSVRLNFNEEFFENFEEKQSERELKDKPRLDLGKFTVDAVKKHVKELMPAFDPKYPLFDKEEDYEVEIAAIKIGYYNGTVIKLLKERGNCLKSDLGNLRKVENKITEALK